MDCAAKCHYDLILIDWHTPVMDGVEATKRIREMDGHHAALPIVASTTSALQNEREKCFASGMNDYLSKLATEKTLKTVLQKWLNGNSDPKVNSFPQEIRLSSP